MKRLCKYLIALTASILLLLPASQIESIQAEEMQAAETFHATDLTGTAYATLDTSTGEFVFHRTAPGEKVPKKSGTVLVYSGFETRNYSRFGVPWRANHLDIKTIRMEADIQPTSMAFWFAECSGLVSADFSRLDTSKTTSLSSTFMGCTSLKTINVSSWDTSSLSGLSDTFYNCKSLKELNVSDWDTSNFTTLRNAFYGCTSLTSLDLSGWDVSQVTNMDNLFRDCTSLESLNLSGWNVINSSKMAANAFSGDSRLNKVILTSGFLFNSAVLPYVRADGYTGLWAKEDALETGYSPSALAALSGADIAGTWVWQPVQNKYYVEFDGNGAAGSMAKTLADVNEAYTLPECSFYWADHEFAGWSLDKEGAQIMEAGSSQILSDQGQTAVTLYAQWKTVGSAQESEGWYTFTLKGDEQAVFENLPTVGSYSVYEQTEEGWVLVEAENASGNVLPSETSKANFTNRKTEDAAAQMIAEKTVDGETPDTIFTFELMNGNETIATAQNAADGTILFPVQTYSEEGEYKYAIKEVNDHQDGYEYDDSTFTATVTVTKNEDGNLSADVSYDQTPIFDNTRIVQYGTLTVSKTVVKGDSDQDFTFQLNLYDEDGRVWTENSKGMAYLGDKLESISNGYEFTLKDGESVLFTLPDGIRYEVMETDIPAGYTSSSQGAAGQIVNGETSFATFTNTYSNPYTNNPATAIIQASKVLEGAELEDGEFTFVLEGAGETYTASNSLDGLVSFELTFDEAGTYEYTLKELAGDSDDIEYDDSEYGVTVQVTESASRLIASVSYDSTPVFTNTMKPGSLSVSKTVVDAPEADDTEFSFVLHLSDSDGKALTEKYSVKDSEEKLGDGDSFVLTDGSSLVLENIPAGTVYSIEEEALSGWTLSSVSNTSGTIVSNSVSSASFENTFSPEPVSLILTASKTLSGADLTAGQFTFELLDEEDNVLSSAVNDENGNIVFDEIVYDSSDIGQTYVYTVREVNDRQPYITYDSIVYTRTVGVSEKDGKVVYSLSSSDPIVFENTYSYAASGSVKLTGHKTLEGADLASGQFEFEAVDEDGSVVTTGLNSASGDISFDAIVYGVSDVGEHTYTVREVRNVLDFFTEYDDTSYSVSVLVSDNGDGTLTCSVSGGDKLSFVNVHRSLNVPFTGETGIGLGILSGIGLLAGSAYLFLKKRD